MSIIVAVASLCATGNLAEEPTRSAKNVECLEILVGCLLLALEETTEVTLRGSKCDVVMFLNVCRDEVRKSMQYILVRASHKDEHHTKMGFVA